jgi:hypothetical protein
MALLLCLPLCPTSPLGGRRGFVSASDVIAMGRAPADLEVCQSFRDVAPGARARPPSARGRNLANKFAVPPRFSRRIKTARRHECLRRRRRARPTSPRAANAPKSPSPPFDDAASPRDAPTEYEPWTTGQAVARIDLAGGAHREGRSDRDGGRHDDEGRQQGRHAASEGPCENLRDGVGARTCSRSRHCTCSFRAPAFRGCVL